MAGSTIEPLAHPDIDLIVMATHGRTGLEHVLIGSVAEKVVRLAPCPVLTVKAHAVAAVLTALVLARGEQVLVALLERLAAPLLRLNARTAVLRVADVRTHLQRAGWPDVVAMASAWLLLCERPNAAEVTGGLVLIAGVLVAMRRRSADYAEVVDAHDLAAQR